jgi:peptidoglycan-associated lipoprotein
MNKRLLLNFFLRCLLFCLFVNTASAQVNVVNEIALNSEKSDWGTTVYGKDIVFLSDRENNVKLPVKKIKQGLLKFDGVSIKSSSKGDGLTGNSYLRLYQLSGNVATLFPINVRTDYYVGATSFTADGYEMFFTLARIGGKDKGDKKGTNTINLEIYSSIKDPATGLWGQPVSFPHNNVKEYSNVDPFIAPDGKVLYFVSSMNGGKGGTDIYYSVKNGKGEWETPINITAINTAGNERTPSIGPDAIYFASDGHIGLGNLDIFKATRNGNIFTDVRNLGYPLNSSQNDFAYLSTGINTGYFSSDRAGGLGGDDIYSFVERSKPIIPASSLEGTAIDITTKAPLANSTITLTKANGTTLTVKTDNNGKFKFDLEGGTTYVLSGGKASYIPDYQGITTAGLTTSMVIRRDLFLMPSVARGK